MSAVISDCGQFRYRLDREVRPMLGRTPRHGCGQARSSGLSCRGLNSNNLSAGGGSDE
jgi:hypothetical protein